MTAAVLEGGACLPVEVLIPISLMVMMLGIFSCAFWPFTSLLWRNICSDPLPTFLNLGDFFLNQLLLSCKRSYVPVRYKSANILSRSVVCLVPFLMFSFKFPKFLILIKSDISFTLFLLMLLVSYLRNPWLIPGHEDLLLCFLLVAVSALTGRFLILWIM